MAEYHKQCLLLKEGRIHRMAWIPEKFAIKNKVLKIKGEDGWVVHKVGSRQESSIVRNNSQEYKKHRNGTDI